MVHVEFTTKTIPNGAQKWYTQKCHFLCRDADHANMLIEEIKVLCINKLQNICITEQLFN